MNKKKLVCGWGINDADYLVYRYKYINSKKVCTWKCPYYQDWVGMLTRIFHEKSLICHPTYRECAICGDWRYFSSFIKWVDSQPNKDWQNCSLDKDLLSTDNKMYSPNTCVYVSTKINNFIIDGAKTRGKYMIGVVEVTKKLWYRSQCRNPFTGKADKTGCFPTELEAHKAWQAKKHEHALKLADLQEDERVAKRLREMYSPDKDWTKA